MKVHLAGLYAQNCYLKDYLDELVFSRRQREALDNEANNKRGGQNECISRRGGSGNNRYIYTQNTPPEAMSKLLGKDMNICLAGLNAEQNRPNAKGDFKQYEKIYILESFYYIKEWMEPYIKNHWHFLLDSGAFTFMQGADISKIDWDEYVERYAHFINRMNIKHFIELDIDAIVGIKEVERLRNKLERLTNKQSMPVFHKARGKDYWLRMIKQYNYVCLGGLAKVKNPNHTIRAEFFNWFLETAKKENCKVHALGYTSEKGLKQYPFYSVDSTAWLMGNISGYLYVFNGSGFDKIEKPKGTRLNSREVVLHNFKEWIKFQRYANRFL